MCLTCVLHVCNTPVSKVGGVEASYSKCPISDYPASIGYTKDRGVY